MRPPGRALPYAVAVLVTVLWSSSYVLIKWGLSDIPPLYFATLRYGLAFAVLLVVDLGFGERAKKVDGSAPGKRTLLTLVVAGISGYTVAQGLQFVGLYYLPAVTTSFILNFSPVFVLAIGALVLGEGASKAQFGGLILALLGAYTFFSERVAWSGGWYGVAVVLASGAGWAVYVVAVRSLHRFGAVGSLRLTTITLGVGVLGMAALTAATGQYATLTPGGMAMIGWLAVANTALAFFLWNWSLKAVPAYELTVLQNGMLVEIALFAYVFLQETITLPMIAGMILVLLGVFVVQTSGARGRPGSLARTAAPGVRPPLTRLSATVQESHVGPSIADTRRRTVAPCARGMA